MKRRSLQLKEKKLLKQLAPKLQPDNWLIIKKLPKAWHLENKESGKIRIVELNAP
ncbi:DUF6906 family protein [Brevibacillus borstelensis]|uniref:DUF6906 family protein n=1 Tax=Brevibacillus borstelensis TaxID=45462 RepID=UPI00137651F5|nr:hypothetical protein [Brevibacillus borstelensis]